MDLDPGNTKTEQPRVDFQGGNQASTHNESSTLQGFGPAVPVIPAYGFGFVMPPSTDSYGGHGGTNPSTRAGGFDPEATSAGGNYNKLVDPESLNVKNFSFNDQSIRRGFIRKVYSILMVQLLVTFGVVTLFVYHMPTQKWAAENIWLFYVTMGMVLISTVCMACCEELLRKTPTNFVLLGWFTASESIVVGYITTLYEPEVVMMAVGITVILCLGLTLFALQSKYDFTAWGGMLLTALLILIMVSLVAIFFPGRAMNMLISSCGALLFSFYLIYDTQLMMGGEHKYSISPEEYIFASINLYLDIINLFLYILRILGSKK